MVRLGSWLWLRASSLGSIDACAGAQIFGHSDLHTRYDRGDYSAALLKSVSIQLIASLFYMELPRVPRFYRSPERCHIYMHCRIPPGHTLLDLLYRFHHLSTRIIYRGDEIQYAKMPLPGLATLQRCRAGKPFRKTVVVEVSSVRAKVEVTFSGLDRSHHNISHCPYELRQLIRDQGLDNVFGRSDHQPYQHQMQRRRQPGREQEQAFIEMEKVLRQVQENGSQGV